MDSTHAQAIRSRRAPGAEHLSSNESSLEESRTGGLVSIATCESYRFRQSPAPQGRDSVSGDFTLVDS